MLVASSPPTVLFQCSTWQMKQEGMLLCLRISSFHKATSASLRSGGLRFLRPRLLRCGRQLRTFKSPAAICRRTMAGQL
uniref:Uncharacterized protein n=1 Tax=Triticum urartu TaxID=4572 RepID=A0A8R7UNS6_TRIUA